MKLEEFLNKCGKFEHLFEIVEEPEYSRDMLLSLQEKYASSGVNSYDVYWHYKVQGFKYWADFIPEIEDWVYHYESFLKYGGNPDELKKYEDDSQGQVPDNEKKMSGHKDRSSFLFGHM